MKFKILYIVLILYASCKNPENKNVQLVGWNPSECDGTYDPYILIDRITELRVQDDITHITVNFADNCCIDVKPKIQFKNKALYLNPYSNSDGASCDCDCCFSIEFEIEGLKEKTYDIYFQGKKIKQSNEPYKVVRPTSQVHDGKIINRTNRYGFKEGTWMTFYENGKLKALEQYSEHVLRPYNHSLWEKIFYANDKLSSFNRKDTSESWFENGRLQSQHISYEKDDTSYYQELEYYKNGKLDKKSLERHYPGKFRSEFDSSYQSDGSRREDVYDEEYFENGKLKSRFGKDSSVTWYPSGKVQEVRKSSEFNRHVVTYNETGFVKQICYNWRTRGPKWYGDLEHSLVAEIARNGTVLKIDYRQDEEQATEDGKAIASQVYQWKWNSDGKLLKSPKGWKDEAPWKRFLELHIH